MVTGDPDDIEIPAIRRKLRLVIESALRRRHKRERRVKQGIGEIANSEGTERGVWKS